MIAPLFFAIALAGDWTGTSLCTDLKALPACHDEQVIYHITEVREDLVHLAADKVVDGKPESMGEFDMKRDGTHLINEGSDRQDRKFVWDFEVKGDKIEGVLKMMPGDRIVRKVAVTRKR
jgi:hypothetical protein